MHMNHFKDVKLLLYIFETRVQRFWGQILKSSGSSGLLSGVMETANKTPNLSSVFTDSQCTLYFCSHMHMGQKKLGKYSYVCEKDACKVLRHNSISKWAVGATAIYLAKASKITHPRC